MKKYMIPNIEITAFSIEDVIAQSGVVVNVSQLSETDADMYKVYNQNSAVHNEYISVFTW